MPSVTEQIALRDVTPVTVDTHSGDRTVRTTHRSLGLGLLLAVVGGFLDAFTYVGHGHVFANAMSGNVVLVGVSIVAGQWTQAMRCLTAVLAFLAGVATANLLHLPRVTAVVRRPKLDCLLLELAFLLIVGGLPAGYPDYVTTLGISFVAAVQTSTFRELRDWPYSSVMTTGNLRSFVDATVAWLSFRGRAEARKLAHFGTVCSAFFGGALLGGACTAAWGNYTAWLAAALIGAAVLLLGFNARSTAESGSVPPEESAVRPHQHHTGGIHTHQQIL
jgi:uncharacterized membrane protein YoaK (UPF0700 family)